MRNLEEWDRRCAAGLMAGLKALGYGLIGVFVIFTVIWIPLLVLGYPLCPESRSCPGLGILNTCSLTTFCVCLFVLTAAWLTLIPTNKHRACWPCLKVGVRDRPCLQCLDRGIIKFFIGLYFVIAGACVIGIAAFALMWIVSIPMGGLESETWMPITYGSIGAFCAAITIFVGVYICRVQETGKCCWLIGGCRSSEKGKVGTV